VIISPVSALMSPKMCLNLPVEFRYDTVRGIVLSLARRLDSVKGFLPIFLVWYLAWDT
jgi:hypothetical protein